ncbi:ribonuclease BN [Flammeovirgaceae bacterium 311]|nr:ribonuclease BN [Flammeovirgaceae bacterium 311]
MENDPFRLSAVIAYYTVFSMPGLFVIIFYVTGKFFSGVAIRGQVYRELSDILGSQGARQVEETIVAASEAQHSTIATIIGVASLVYAATGVFFHLKISLNDIWELKVIPERAFKQLIVDRLFAFGMVLVVGFLLLSSLIVSSIVTAVSGYMTEHVAVYSNYSTYIIDIVNFVISATVITLLFATIYKVLPDANVSWSDVWIGALVTSLLFLAGKALIAKYIGIADPASAYGAASSIILILLWTSYASLIFFLGAAFTAVWAKRYGHRIEPKHYAVPVYEYYRRISQKGEAEYVKVQSEKVKQVLDNEFDTPRLTDEGEKPPLELTEEEMAAKEAEEQAKKEEKKKNIKKS